MNNKNNFITNNKNSSIMNNKNNFITNNRDNFITNNSDRTILIKKKMEFLRISGSQTKLLMIFAVRGDLMLISIYIVSSSTIKAVMMKLTMQGEAGSANLITIPNIAKMLEEICIIEMILTMITMIILEE